MKLIRKTLISPAINPHNIARRGLSTKDAAWYMGISQETLRKMRNEDRARIEHSNSIMGPVWIKLDRRVIYLVDDLNKWLEKGRITHA